MCTFCYKMVHCGKCIVGVLFYLKSFVLYPSKGLSVSHKMYYHKIYRTAEDLRFLHQVSSRNLNGNTIANPSVKSQSSPTCSPPSHYLNQCRVTVIGPFWTNFSETMRWWYVLFLAWVSGPRLNIKTVLSTYGDFHVKDKTAVRTSYL